MICPPGSYYDAVNGCSQCQAGQFCPLAIGGHRTAGDTDLDCPDGTYSLAGAIECSLCKPGTKCPSKGAPGTACDPGTYQVGGSPTCTQCPKNHECSIDGSTIAPCPLFFYAEAGDGYCKPCPDGKDCRDIRSTVDPVDCIGGFYSRPLDFMCVPCPRGHSCAAGAAEPAICLGG